MAKKNIKSVAASFNLDDERQRKAYEYIKSQSNSSYYLKSLVLLDMAEHVSFKRTNQTEPASKEKQRPVVEFDFNSFI